MTYTNGITLGLRIASYLERKAHVVIGGIGLHLLHFLKDPFDRRILSIVLLIHLSLFLPRFRGTNTDQKIEDKAEKSEPGPDHQGPRRSGQIASHDLRNAFEADGRNF